MTLEQRIALLSELGEYLRGPADAELEACIQQSYFENRWFTPENTKAALSAIAENMLQKDLLEAWAAQYPIRAPLHPERIVGMAPAGNIPLVNFHDWLCAFVAGWRSHIKLSDKDKRLLPFLIKKMSEWSFEVWEYVYFNAENEPLRNFNAVIATGSNNTARYFERYFAAKPHIIRRNRNGAAILDGTESIADLYALGRDIFAYFGLGCRNVSKIYVPAGYAFETLLEALHEYRELANHDKYKNNFDYNMTLYILNNTPYMNNGCLLLREDASLNSRIASVHYAYYDNAADLEEKIAAQKENLQCIVGKNAGARIAGIPLLSFGKSQEPGLTDYPDGVDVMAFLTGLSNEQ